MIDCSSFSTIFRHLINVSFAIFIEYELYEDNVSNLENVQMIDGYFFFSPLFELKQQLKKLSRYQFSGRKLLNNKQKTEQ